MTTTADPTGGNIELTENGGPPANVGDIVLNGGVIQAKDDQGVYDLRGAAGRTIEVAPQIEETGSTSYETLGRMIYGGSTDWNTIEKALAIAWTSDAGKPADVRFYDETNSLVIAELTGITDTAPTIQDLGTLSNVPTGAAVIAIQAKRPSGSPSSAFVATAALVMAEA